MSPSANPGSISIARGHAGPDEDFGIERVSNRGLVDFDCFSDRLLRSSIEQLYGAKTPYTIGLTGALTGPPLGATPQMIECTLAPFLDDYRLSSSGCGGALC